MNIALICFGNAALLCSRNSSYWEFSPVFYLFVVLGFVTLGGHPFIAHFFTPSIQAPTTQPKSQIIQTQRSRLSSEKWIYDNAYNSCLCTLPTCTKPQSLFYYIHRLLHVFDPLFLFNKSSSFSAHISFK